MNMVSIDISKRLTLDEIAEMSSRDMDVLKSAMALVGSTLIVVPVPLGLMENTVPKRYVLQFNGTRRLEFADDCKEAFPTKIDFIRGIRAITNLGLANAKEIFDKADEGRTIRMMNFNTREEAVATRVSLMEQIARDMRRQAIPYLLEMFTIIEE